MLQAENLIDIIGEQGHAFTTTAPVVTMKRNLDSLASTGLHIQITELDIDGPSDAIQLQSYQRIFPALYEHHGVEGITLWGWRRGLWRDEQGAYIINQDGSERPALEWLRQYLDTLTLGTVYHGPPLAEGQGKFLGCAYQGSPDPDFNNYWTQLTPENAGKFGSVATTSDTSTWNWSGLDAAYNYAINNHLIFKEHCLIWGAQQPSWLSNCDTAQQRNAVETWIRKVGERYPKMDFVDVVNEPMKGHSQPSYKDALGGDGDTGWDWVIWAFQKARQYMPNAKLILNEYNIMNGYSTSDFIKLVDLLKARGLIDGIGVQGHRDQWENQQLSTLNSNLNKLTATGIPVYISELDVAPNNIVNDSAQLAEYQRIFPMIWENPGVKGITIWGYKEGRTSYFPATYLVRSDGTARPALLWLAQYINDHPVGIKESATTDKLPSKYELKQNFPNPFNPTTNIRYSIIKTSKVTLKIFDILGREVQTLVNTVQSPGQYTVTFNAQDLANGVYFYQLNAGDFTTTKKLMLLK